QMGGLSTSVGCRDLDQDVFDITLRIFHDYIKIAVLAEYPGIEQFKLWLISSEPMVLFDQLRIRIRSLRVLVQVLHVGVRRSAIEIEVIFFDILAMIAFVAGQAEKTFFQNWVMLIPERH